MNNELYFSTDVVQNLLFCRVCKDPIDFNRMSEKYYHISNAGYDHPAQPDIETDISNLMKELRKNED